MKRVIIKISLAIIALIMYLLQSNFFNWFTIAGVMPNILIIYVLFIGLFTNRKTGAIYRISNRINSRFISKPNSAEQPQ